MLAYADWSGLRPLSELEYEKMCRVLYPELPSSPDYAWGSVSPSPAEWLAVLPERRANMLLLVM